MIPRMRPSYRKVDWSKVQAGMEGLINVYDVWKGVRDIIDGLPRAGTGSSRCKWWLDVLENMKLDIRYLRRKATHDPAQRTSLQLATKVYKSTIDQSRYDHIKNMLAKSKNPDIFLYIHALETSQILPGSILVKVNIPAPMGKVAIS